MRLVVDTNVLISALLTPSGIPARIVERLLRSTPDVLLYELRILAEYRVVLGRPGFAFDADAVSDLMGALVSSGLLVDAPPLPLRLPDADDLPFLEVAAAGHAHALVTGNARHFVPVEGTHDVPVASPREALELINRS